MKIIPDSNIFIDFWKHPTEEIEKIFENEEIILCGAVRAELLQGEVSVKNFTQISDGVDSFQEVNLESGDWGILGENLYLLRTNGLTVPLADAIIATVAIKYGIPVWTNDKHFGLMSRALRGLNIWNGDGVQ